MKHLLVIPALLIALTLTACGPSPQGANEQAAAFCAIHGGLKSLHYYPSDLPGEDSGFNAECNDGSEFN